MARVRAVILRAAGTNCDVETQHAWHCAGAAASRVHVRRLIERPQVLDDYQVLTIPGGFSYGDDIAAGRILAAQVRRHLLDQVRRFIDADKLVLGICNGFQVLVQTGILPRSGRPAGRRTCTITGNQPPGFQDRWVHVRAGDTDCVFLEPGRTYELPIAHAEGRVVFADEQDFEAVVASGHSALTYTHPPDGTFFGRYGARPLPCEPCNPNGSVGDIAGLCDQTGRVLGLMPHPERFVTGTQHPCWTSQVTGQRPVPPDGDGLDLFRRAVAYFS